MKEDDLKKGNEIKREIEFILKMQGGVENWHENSEERKAYAEFMRGLKKLMELNLQAEAK